LDWAPPPRPCRASSTGPRGLRIITVPRERFRPRFILLRASIRLQSLTSQCPPPVVSDWVVPSVRFRASSRHQHPGSAVTMGSRPPPPSALRFSQPLGGLLPETPCGLISSHWHVQASPSGGFPPQEPLRLIAAAVPSCRYREWGSPCEAIHPWPDFRALLPWRIRCARSAVKRAARPIPSWASPLQGLPHPDP